MTDNIKIKTKGGGNKMPIIRFIMMFLLVVGALMTISIITGVFTLKHVVIFSLCSIPLCILCTYAIEKFGDGLGRILSGWTLSTLDRGERFSCEVHKIKYSKREGRFNQALHMVNDLLHEAPDFPEAIFLKAQILWEGFGNASAAKGCLNRIRELTPEDDKFHRWASGYMDRHLNIKGKTHD